MIRQDGAQRDGVEKTRGLREVREEGGEQQSEGGLGAPQKRTPCGPEGSVGKRKTILHYPLTILHAQDR